MAKRPVPLEMLDAWFTPAGLLPDARVAMVPYSYTLIPLDQPQRLATLVREFVKNT